LTDLRGRRLAGNVFVWTLGGESVASSYGSNGGAIIGRDAVLVVDPLIAPSYARLVEEAVRKETSLPIRFVVVTHHHTDHALGAGYFASAGAEVLTHAACRDRMAAEHAGLIASRRSQSDIASLFEDAEAYEPSRTFRDETTLDLGGTVVRVLHPGHNHTPGDAVVHLPGESVVFCGDLVSNGYHVNYEDAAFGKLEGGLNLLRSLGARTYVPGHGTPGGPEILDAQSRYHAAIAQARREADADKAADWIRSRFPDHLLEIVTTSSFSRE